MVTLIVPFVLSFTLALTHPLSVTNSTTASTTSTPTSTTSSTSTTTPTPSQSSAPFTELIAAYPYGVQMSLGVSPDGSRVYVAEGGAIDILDASSTPPSNPHSIDQIELPEASLYSILHYDYPGNQKRLLFIAGGTSGLWKAVLCPEVFAPPPPPGSQVCTCAPQSCDRWERTNIDIAEYTGIVRKRCVDVAVVEGNAAAGVPLLCAIFTARSDSPVGPSELRVYKVKPDFSVVLKFILALPGPANHPDAAATALVADPADHDSVYVAVGTAWLYKVDLNTQTAAPFPSGQILPNNQMRDLAVVRTTTQGTFIYASLDSGQIFEYSLLAGTVSQTPLACSFADRIAAVTDGGNNVVVGVALQQINGRSQDSSWRPGHLWYEECLGVGIPDPNVSPEGWLVYCANPLTPCCNEVRFYRRDTSQSGSQLALFLTVPRDNVPGLVDPTGWGTLELRTISPTLVRSYECAIYSATMVREISNPFSISVPQVGQVTQYIGPGNGSGDGPVSLRNPGLPHFGGESRGEVVEKRLYITNPITNPPTRILPMEDIECPRPTLTSDCRFISPFGGTVFGEANWLAADGVGEWFFTGTRTWKQTTDQCFLIDFPDNCYDDSCGTGADRFWTLGALPGGNGNKVGWWLIYMNPAGNPPTWSSLNLRWYQIAAPTAANNDERNPLHDILTSQADPRTVIQVAGSNPPGVTEVTGNTPVLIHGVRFASHWGYKVFRTRDLLAATHQTCEETPTNPGTPPSRDRRAAPGRALPRDADAPRDRDGWLRR